MKNLMLGVAAVVGFVSFADSAEASCNRRSDSYVCRGDTVFSPTGFEGKALGVNPRTSKVTVKWLKNPQRYSRDFQEAIAVEDLAIAEGCLRNICVGDTVYSSTGFEGVAVGMNPHAGKVAVHWTRNPQRYSRDFVEMIESNELAVARGCAMGICVGDLVYSPTGFEGTVKGVRNGRTKKAAVHWTKNPQGYSRDFVEQIKASELASAEFCADYTDDHRRYDDYAPISREYRDSKKLEGFDHEFRINIEISVRN